MANIIVTFKIMPESPDVNLESLTEQINEIIENEGGSVGKSELQPIGFGIKALMVTFVRDEAKGNTDAMEETLSELTGVESVETTDVRRTIG